MAHKAHDNKEKLLEQMASSNPNDAFKTIYMSYYLRIMNFVGLYVDSRNDVEEIVQNTFLALWQNRKSMKEIQSFDAYIYTIARRRVVSYYRIKRINSIPLEEGITDVFADEEVNPEYDLIRREEIHRLNTAINTLPSKCKMVFKLVKEDKLKYREVAEILNISVKTVETHLATAIRKLREALGE